MAAAKEMQKDFSAKNVMTPTSSPQVTCQQSQCPSLTRSPRVAFRLHRQRWVVGRDCAVSKNPPYLLYDPLWGKFADPCPSVTLDRGGLATRNLWLQMIVRLVSSDTLMSCMVTAPSLGLVRNVRIFKIIPLLKIDLSAQIRKKGLIYS